MEEVGDLVKTLLRLAKVSERFNHKDKNDCLRMSAALQRFTEADWENAIRENADEVIVTAYMQDGWGSNVSSGHAYTDGFYIVRRKGKIRAEFLLQRALMKIMKADGDIIYKMRFYEPIGLSLGRKAWNCFTGCCESFTAPRQDGALGITLTAYLMDGCLFQPLSEHFTARHILYYDHQRGMDRDLDNLERKVTDWVLPLKCKAHSCSNAVNEGNKTHRYGIDIKELHCAIAAVRNSATALFANLESFLRRCAYPTLQRTGSDADIRSFWSLLDIDAARLDEFVSLDLRWDQGCLKICCEALDEATFERVEAAVAYCLKWYDYADTRWAKLGPSGRLLYRSLPCGLDALVAQTLADQNFGNAHLHGFEKLDSSMRKYLASAGIAARPAESLLLEILHDDRVGKWLRKYWAVVEEEINYILNLRAYTWRRIALLASDAWDASDCKHQTLHAALVTVGYLYMDIFYEFELYPQCLAQGNVKENLTAFAALPLDPNWSYMTYQIWTSIHVALPLTRIERAVSAQLELPHSTELVEQGHASGAVIKKHGGLIGEATLRSKCTLHQARPLFAITHYDKKEQRLLRDIERLSKPLQKKLGGRQMFFKQFNSASSYPPGSATFVSQQRRMSDHVTDYNDLSKRARLSLDRDAASHVRQQQAERDGELEEAQNSLDLLRLRRDLERRDSGILNSLDEARFNDSQKEGLLETYNALLETEGVDTLREECYTAPSVPTASQQLAFINCVRDINFKRFECPWWQYCVSNLRDTFRHTIIYKMQDGVVNRWYYHLFSQQGPWVGAYLELERSTLAEMRGFCESATEPYGLLPLCSRAFTFLPLRPKLSVQITFTEEDELFVLHDCRILGHSFSSLRVNPTSHRPININ
jgi:hypothetical protein